MANSFIKSVTKTTIIYGLLLTSAEGMAVTASQLAFTSGDKTPNVKAQLLNLGQTSHFKTTPSSVKEIMLTDGSVLTIGLNSEVLVDLKNKKTHVELIQGSLRITSGVVQPALVTTSTCGHSITSEIINSSGFFESNIESGFKVVMVYGKQINVNDSRKSITIVKPGYAVEMPAVSSNCRLSRPNRLAVNELSSLLTQTETNILALGGLPSPSAGEAVSKVADADAQTVTTALADDDSSETTNTNSNSDEGSTDTGGGTDTSGTDTGGTTGGGTDSGGTDTGGTDSGGADTGGGTDMGGVDPTPDPIPDPMPDPVPPPLVIPDRTDDIQVADATSDGFGPGATVDAPDLADGQASQVNFPALVGSQSFDLIDTDPGSLADPIVLVRKSQGRTSNRFYRNGVQGAQSLVNGGSLSNYENCNGGEECNPFKLAVNDAGMGNPPNYETNMSYTFFNRSLIIDTPIFPTGSSVNNLPAADPRAPIFIRNVDFGNDNQIYSTTLETVFPPTPELNQGGPFNQATQYNILSTGFSQASASSLVDISSDNFLFLQASEGIHSSTFRDSLRANTSLQMDPVAFYVASLGGRNEARLGRSFSSYYENRQQIDEIAQVVINGVAATGITSVLSPNDVGYAAYVASIQSDILGPLDALANQTGNNINMDMIRDVREAFIGFTNGSITFSATANISALTSFTLSNGQVSDPIQFLAALGSQVASANNVDFTINDLNNLMASIVNYSGDAIVLGSTDISSYSFLEADQQTSLLNTINDVTGVAIDPFGTMTYTFAAGDVDGRLASNGFTGPTFSVDQFHIGSGVNSCSDNTVCDFAISGAIENGIRAFSRNQTALGLNLTDTGLLVVNQAAEGTNDQTALLHVDFALSGEGSEQRSTISATIGDLSYQQVAYDDPACSSNDCVIDSIEVSAEGQTIGSSQGNINYADSSAPVQREDVAFNSPFRLTAAGGGNPNLNRQGYAGYLVLENYDPTPQVSGDAAILGGTESTIGNSLGSSTSDVDYANLRLATANGNTGNGSVGDTYSVGMRSNTTLNGWAAGLANREEQGSAGLTVTQIDSDLDPTNVSISTDAATNRVAAMINLYNHAPLQLGGLTGDDSKGASAFVDNDNYAARTLDTDSSAQVAMVSGGLVEAGLPAGSIPDYDYVQWGFFFGDTAVSATSREHVHLGSWVAGDVTALADLPSTGSATYSGHTIGNVFSGGENYTAIGTYNNSWDFGTRRGTATMNFDSTSYSGDTQIRDNSIVFDGVVNGGGRTGALHGNFVQGGGDPVAGVTGRFSIQNTAGNPDYRASGTFAGEKD